MRWDDDPIGVFIAIVITCIFVPILVGVAGSGIMKPTYITEGRNQGIIFCSEKPKECDVEYSYIKLKETQK